MAAMGCFQLQGALANIERLQPLAGQGQQLIATEPLALQAIVINYQMGGEGDAGSAQPPDMQLLHLNSE